MLTEYIYISTFRTPLVMNFHRYNPFAKDAVFKMVFQILVRVRTQSPVYFINKNFL